MKRKISLKHSLLIVSVVGVIFFLIVIFLPAHVLPSQNIVAKSVSTEKNQATQKPVDNYSIKSTQISAIPEFNSSGLSIRLKIPKINVDAAVESVGLTPEGAMDAPKGPINVGWFNLGPRLGEKGSAVIDGHFGWYNGKPAVFDNLNKLQKGDKLYVEDEKGAITTFVVRMSRSYNPEADASDVFSSKDGEAHLNLITCEGVWDKATKSYSNRLVVFTDKEME